MPRYIRAGKYNEIHESDLPVIVGAGTSASNRKDIMTMDWDGNVELAGGITSGGDFSADGDFSATGNAEIGGDVKINGDKVELLSGNAEIKITKRLPLTTLTTRIDGSSVHSDAIFGDAVYADDVSLFVPYMNNFRLFFDYPTHNNEVYFSIPSKVKFPETARNNATIIECIRTFLWVFDYKKEEHLNTSYLVLTNHDKIFAIRGTINNCPVIGIYVYTGSDTPRYQIDIICIDSSETSGYKVYTWVNDPNATPSTGETYITLENDYINSYAVSLARFV